MFYYTAYESVNIVKINISKKIQTFEQTEQTDFKGKMRLCMHFEKKYK